MITSGSFSPLKASGRSMSRVRPHRLDRLALDIDRLEAYSSLSRNDPEVIGPTQDTDADICRRFRAETRGDRENPGLTPRALFLSPLRAIRARSLIAVADAVADSCR
jgi:hypothetical protein